MLGKPEATGCRHTITYNNIKSDRDYTDLCRCVRCEDPRDLGSLGNALLCPSCRCYQTNDNSQTREPPKFELLSNESVLKTFDTRGCMQCISYPTIRHMTYDNLIYDNPTYDNPTYDNPTYDNSTYDNLTHLPS